MKYRLFGVGLKGKSPVISSQHRINCYLEKIIDEDTEQTAAIASPGMDDFCTTLGDTPNRGWCVEDDFLYTIHRAALHEITNAGTTTARGSISTSVGRVDLASDGLVILIVDGTEGYTYTIASTTLAVIADSDFPDTSESCAWLGGYFIAFGPGDGFQISEDGTTWDPLDIASADVGGIVRGTADHGELVIFGKNKMVFWAHTGTADFPFAPVISAAKEIGLAAKWSLTKFDDSLVFLGKNPSGQVQVYKLQGHVPVSISSPELDSIINRYVNVADATGYSYMFEGHPFYRINFPAAGKSWEFDGLTQLWHERQSGLDGERHRGEMAIDFNNKIRVADYENGNIYTVNASTYTESGDHYPMELTSKRVVSDYEPFSLSRLFLDFETGTGLTTGIGSDPQVMLTVSRDGGRTFGNEMWKDLGAIGKYLTRVEYHQFGTADSFIFRLRITEPVKRHLVNASLIE